MIDKNQIQLTPPPGLPTHIKTYWPSENSSITRKLILLDDEGDPIGATPIEIQVAFSAGESPRVLIHSTPAETFEDDSYAVEIKFIDICKAAASWARDVGEMEELADYLVMLAKMVRRMGAER